MKVKIKFGPRHKHLNWTIETTPDIRNNLLAKERIYVRWLYGIGKDQIMVVRTAKLLYSNIIKVKVLKRIRSLKFFIQIREIRLLY